MKTEKLSILIGTISTKLTLNNYSQRFFSRIQLQNVVLILLAITIVANWIWLEQLKEEGGYPNILLSVLWVLVLIFCLWLGNLLIYRLLRRLFSWESSFNIRFFLQLFLSVVYSLICINLSYLLIKNYYTELPPDQDQMILLNIYGTLFIIPVLSIQFGLVFLHKWKKATLAQEELKKEQIQSELTALKSHLSPHFLFNNLNILSSLIQLDKQIAQDYLDEFAEVYRYVLKNRKVELVPLQDELQFLDSYSFLLRQRFPDGLKIHVDVPMSFLDSTIPPLSLQILIENALKHNKLSEINPLEVNIFIETSPHPKLVIENNLQIRNVLPQEKTGFGLENVKRRYWLIAQREIEIKCSDDFFKVALPLLHNYKKHGHSDHRR